MICSVWAEGNCRGVLELLIGGPCSDKRGGVIVWKDCCLGNLVGGNMAKHACNRVTLVVYTVCSFSLSSSFSLMDSSTTFRSENV